MTAKIINGNEIANSIKDNLKIEIDNIIKFGKRPPALTVILIGDNPASKVYVKNKAIACKKVGIISNEILLPSETTEEKLCSIIDELNNNNSIDAILLQLPIPKHIDSNKMLELINPKKDVDGFHPYNIGKLAQRTPILRPCTPFGIIHLIKSTNTDIKGKNAVIVGASNIVGRPMMLELLLEGATVTCCHKFTKDLNLHISQADILVVAVGKAEFIQGNNIKTGCIVIDVGINRLDDGKLTGDIEFDIAKTKASFITPVPGGVGPMTITYLLKNTLFAYKNK